MLIQLVILQVLTFLGIVFVLRKLLYTETAKESRRLRILKEENDQKQKELQLKMESAETAYKESVAKAQEEIKRIRAGAQEEIEALKQEQIAKGREEGERIIKTALNAKEKMREEIALQMKHDAPALASQIFKEFLSPRIKEMVHRELAAKVIGEIKNMPKARFEVKIKKAQVASAYPLSKDERDALAALILEKAGDKAQLEEKEDRELVAGIVVKLDTLVIDGSLLNRLKQIK
jgi:F-type H+-transporting ATPase subunit b